MPGPFAIAFRQHVIPHLRKRCAVNSCMLALDFWDWNEAFYDCLHLACNRGALKLDDATFRQLQDWIATELLERTEELAHVIR